VKWRTPITLAVLVVILLGAAFYGWQSVIAPAQTSSDSSHQTRPTNTHPTKPRTTQVCVQRKTWPKGDVVHAYSFRVNVYNAGGVSGEAAQVLSDLDARGFKSGIAANPPANVTATNVSILTSTPTSPRIQLVKEQFRGAVRLVAGPQLAAGIDVIIGPKFAGALTDAPGEYTVPRDTPVCMKFVTRKVR
jgi:hypothetical protein